MISEQSILFSAVLVTIISASVGMVGLISAYAIFPIFYPEPTCICESLNESYEKLRQLTTIFGWFFSFIPFIYWRIWINRELKKEIEV